MALTDILPVDDDPTREPSFIAAPDKGFRVIMTGGKVCKGTLWPIIEGVARIHREPDVAPCLMAGVQGRYQPDHVSPGAPKPGAIS